MVGAGVLNPPPPPKTNPPPPPPRPPGGGGARPGRAEAGPPLARRVEVVERLRRDPRRNLGRDAAERAALLDDHRPSRPAHRRDNRFPLEPPQRARVDHLDLH